MGRDWGAWGLKLKAQSDTQKMTEGESMSNEYPVSSIQ